MNYKYKIVVDEICEVGTTARKVTFDAIVTLKRKDGLDRQIYTIETESSDGLGHVGEIVYTGFEKPDSVSIENLAQSYIENNLVENSFDDFFYRY
jgi:hypothetical protein